MPAPPEKPLDYVQRETQREKPMVNYNEKKDSWAEMANVGRASSDYSPNKKYYTKKKDHSVLLAASRKITKRENSDEKLILSDGSQENL